MTQCRADLGEGVLISVIRQKKLELYPLYTEIHRKISLSFTCLVFFLLFQDIGAGGFDFIKFLKRSLDPNFILNPGIMHLEPEVSHV